MYSLTYKFEELRVCYGRAAGGIAEVYGSAEISFDRDRDWTIDSVSVAFASDLTSDGPTSADLFNQDALANALYDQRSGSISVAVVDHEVTTHTVKL